MKHGSAQPTPIDTNTPGAPIATPIDTSSAVAAGWAPPIGSLDTIELEPSGAGFATGSVTGFDFTAPLLLVTGSPNTTGFCRDGSGVPTGLLLPVPGSLCVEPGVDERTRGVAGEPVARVGPDPTGSAVVTPERVRPGPVLTTGFCLLTPDCLVTEGPAEGFRVREGPTGFCLIVGDWRVMPGSNEGVLLVDPARLGPKTEDGLDLTGACLVGPADGLRVMDGFTPPVLERTEFTGERVGAGEALTPGWRVGDGADFTAGAPDDARGPACRTVPEPPPERVGAAARVGAPPGLTGALARTPGEALRLGPLGAAARGPPVEGADRIAGAEREGPAAARPGPAERLGAAAALPPPPLGREGAAAFDEPAERPGLRAAEARPAGADARALDPCDRAAIPPDRWPPPPPPPLDLPPPRIWASDTAALRSSAAMAMAHQPRRSPIGRAASRIWSIMTPPPPNAFR